MGGGYVNESHRNELNVYRLRHLFTFISCHLVDQNFGLGRSHLRMQAHGISWNHIGMKGEWDFRWRGSRGGTRLLLITGRDSLLPWLSEGPPEFG